MSGPATKSNPRRLVAEAPTLALIRAMYEDEVFGIIDRGTCGVWFICPRCGHLDHNGGTAELLDQWRWRCHKCRRTGTRYLLERMVLEDADYLEQFYDIASEADR